jgi:hypothetical protein
MLGHPLRLGENFAWGMASLAEQAGYESILVLRGEEATRRAVHDALTAAAGTMAGGDVLLVSFSGHGCREEDHNGDEGQGWDETWCLYDGEIVDDQLAGYWRLFEPGVRIVIVADGCHAGGSVRGDDSVAYDTSPSRPLGGRGTVYRGSDAAPSPSRLMGGRGTVHRGSDVAPPSSRLMGGRGTVHRGSGGRSAGAADYSGSGGRSAGAVDYSGSCIGVPPHDTDGIHASVLLLAAAGEDQKAQDGLFTRHLLELWNDGAFTGTFCELYWQVRDRVMTERHSQEPQILMLGSPDLGFPLEPAFHLGRGSRGRGYP